ncbi:MAG TPA: hypothetical protein VEC99_08110, partial [Clostridia bacterium]|nr:hypothetical protein [Clostridia bacterium]
SLLGLLMRPQLPPGWEIVSVTGGGNPEMARGEIVWTGDIPPSPIQVTYTVLPAPASNGPQSVGGELQYDTAGMVNPSTALVPAQSVWPLAIARALREEDGLVRVSLPGEADDSVTVEASSDLSQWVTLTNRTTMGGATVFLDPTAKDCGQRFYRAVLTNRN